MAGFALLLAFDFLGLVLHALGVPLPGGVLGLILLALGLFTGVVKLEWLEQTAHFLLRHMMLFFAPVIVGVIVFKDPLAHEWLPISVGLVGSLLIVLLATGWTMELLLRKSKKDDDER
jgi:holin-like protein